jgi:O-antigen/teichoic acid export membrane protein
MASDSVLPDATGPASLGGLLRDSSLYFVGNVAFKVIGFVMIPFYAHYLSPAQSGVLNLVELAIQVVAIAFGLQAAGAALARIYHDQKTAVGRREAVSTALIGTIVLAACVGLLAILFVTPIAAAVSLEGQDSLLRLAFCAMFFSSIVEIALVYERMLNRARFYLAYSIVTLAVTLSLNIVLIGVEHLGVLGFVISKLAVAVGGCAYLLYRVWREVGLSFRRGVAGALARFGAPLIVSGGSYFAIHFSDRLFLAHVSKADVGVYSLAYNFAFLISVEIGDSFTKVWGVSFYAYASGDGWQNRLAKICRWLIFVLGASAMGISLFGRDVLTLMVPPSYYPPMLMLPVLVFGYFLREVGDFFNSTLLVGIGSGLVGRIAVAGAVMNLLLNAALIPVYGIWGAAWATFGTWAVYCAACWIYAWRQHGLPITPWPLALILALSGAIVWERSAAGPLGPFMSLSADVIAFAVFMMAAIILYLRPAERSEAWSAAASLARPRHQS